MLTYKRFGKVNTTLYWIIDSVFDFVLNLPKQIFSLYVADITQCYKTIPLTGTDNLPDALAFLIKLAFQHHHKKRTSNMGAY